MLLEAYIFLTAGAKDGDEDDGAGDSNGGAASDDAAGGDGDSSGDRDDGDGGDGEALPSYCCSDSSSFRNCSSRRICWSSSTVLA